MSEDVSDQPATGRGRTRPAGAGRTDEELTREVAEQTSPDLQVGEAFRRESSGAASSEPVAEASADELTD